MQGRRFVRSQAARSFVGTLLSLWLVLLPCLPALGLPKGGRVAHGDVSFDRTDTTMTVDQTSSRAIVNYDSFDVAQPETVRFNQPSSSATILNRVQGPGASEIAGRIEANGHVYLINRNGILFTPSSRVDVGGFVASALDLSDGDYLSGTLRFSGGDGRVINEGEIQARSAFLIGAGVANRGVIRADRVALGAAREAVLLDEVAGGRIRLILDNGVATPSSLPPAIGGDDQPGTGTVLNRGTIDASGDSGGVAILQGYRIGQFGLLTAGGTHGAGGLAELLASDRIVIGDGSLTAANAGQTGDGGHIAIVAQRDLLVGAGARIEARGGALSGDGGFVETSGHRGFLVGTAPDVSAGHGRGGAWLLDPFNITIVAGTVTNNLSAGFTSTGLSARVGSDVIASALSKGDVTIRTGAGGAEAGDITNTAVFAYASAHHLTLDAARHVVLQTGSAITNAGSGNLTLQAGSVTAGGSGHGDVVVHAPVRLAGGTFAASGSHFTNSTAGAIIAGSILVNHTGDIALSGRVSADGQVALATTAGGVTVNAGISAGHDATLTATTRVRQNADVNAGRDAFVEAKAGSVTMADGTTTTAGGNVRYAARDDVALSMLNATAGTVSVVAAVGNVTDNTAGETANVTARAARLAAGGSIGAGSGSESDTNVRAVNVAVQNLEAAAGQNLYVESAHATTVGGVGDVTVRHVLPGGGTASTTDADLMGLHATLGVAKFKSAGAIALSEPVRAGTDVFLMTTVGDIAWDAAITAGRDATLCGASNVFQNSDLTAGRDALVWAEAGALAMADGASATTGANLWYAARQNVELSVLNASNGTVTVMANGDILDHTAAETANVTARAARLAANGSIGGAGHSAGDVNAQAIDVAVANLEAGAAQDVHVASMNAVTLGRVGGGLVRLTRFDSGTSAGPILDLTGLAAMNGSVKLKSAGAVTVDEGVQGGVDALVLTTSGGVTLNADVAAGRDAAVLAATDVNQHANVDAGRDAYVEAKAGSVTQADGTTTTAGGTIRYAAGDDVRLSALNTANGAVSIVAGRQITDNTAGETANVTARAARLAAGDSVGASGGTTSDANVRAVNVAVRNLEAAAGQNVYVESTGAVTVGGVGDVTVGQVRFDSGTSSTTDADLTGLRAATGVTKLKSAGAVTAMEAIQAGTDALALTTDGHVTLNAGMTAGRDAAVLAATDVNQHANVDAGRDAYVEAKAGSVTQADGTTTTAGGTIRYAAGDDVRLSALNTANGAVSIVAGRHITDNTAGETANVTARAARLAAGDSVGASGGTAGDANAQAVNVAVRNVEVAAGRNAYVESAGPVTVGGVGNVSTRYARFDSGASTVTDANLAGLVAMDGAAKVKSANGITVTESIYAGTDLLLASAGTVTLNAVVMAMRDATVIAASVAQNAHLIAGRDGFVRALDGSIVMDDCATTAGANLRYAARDDVALAILNAVAGTASVVAVTGHIRDGSSDEAVNVNARAARLEAFGSIGAGGGTPSDLNAQAVNVAVQNLEAAAGQNVYVESAGAITVGAVGNVSTRYARFDSGTSTVTDGNLTGIRGVGGVAKVRSAADIAVAEAIQGGGDVLLQADTGGIRLDAAVTAGRDGTVIADGNIVQRADLVTGRDMQVWSLAGGLTMAEGTTASAGGGVWFEAADDVALSVLSAPNGAVCVQSGGGDVADITADEGPNIVARAALLVAPSGSIGAASGTASDTNVRAVNVAVRNLEAMAKGNVYLDSSGEVTVGQVGAVTVHSGWFDSGTTQPTTLDYAGIRSVNGVTKLKSAGDVVVAETVQAAADALVLTTAGDVTLNADVAAGRDATIVARGRISQAANVTAATGEAVALAYGGSVTMSDGSRTAAGRNIRYAAAGDVALSNLNATNAVTVLAGGSITDSTAAETANVTAQSARLLAIAGSVGAGGHTASDINVQAVNVAVRNLEAAAGQDVYVESARAVTVGGVGVVTSRYARFDSGSLTATDTDLATFGSATGVAKLKSAGTITVAEAVQAGTDALLLAEAGDIVLNAGVTAGRNASVIAAAGVSQSASVVARTGDVCVEAGGGGIAMAPGVTTTAGRNLRCAAQADVALAALAATGTVSVLTRTGDITDANGDSVNVVASAARLSAPEGTVGAPSDRIETDVREIAAEAMGDLSFTAAGDIAIGIASSATRRVRMDSGTTDERDPFLDGLRATGNVAVRSTGGNVTAVGSVVSTEGGNICLIAAKDVALRQADLRTSGGAGAITVWADSDGDRVGDVRQEGGTIETDQGNLYVYGERVLQTAPSVMRTGGTLALKAGREIGLGGQNRASGGMVMEAPELGVDGTMDGGPLANLLASMGSLKGGGKITARHVGLQARADIGSRGDLFDVDAEVLAARTTTGDIFIREPDDVRTGTVSAPDVSAGLPPCVTGQMPTPAAGTITDIRSGRNLALEIGGSFNSGRASAAGTMEVVAGGDVGAAGRRVHLDATTVRELQGKNVHAEIGASLPGDTNRPIRVGLLAAEGTLDVVAVSTGGLANANHKTDPSVNIRGQTVRVQAERLGEWNNPLNLATGDAKVRVTSDPTRRRPGGDDLGHVWAHLNGNIGAHRSGSHFGGMEKDSRLDYPLLGLAIWNGAVVGGREESLREIRRAESFYVETPELKVGQSLFGSPHFLHQYLNGVEGTAMGLAEYVLFGETWIRVPDRGDCTTLVPSVTRKGERLPMPR